MFFGFIIVILMIMGIIGGTIFALFVIIMLMIIAMIDELVKYAVYVIFVVIIIEILIKMNVVSILKLLTSEQIFINILIVHIIITLNSSFIRIKEKIKRIDNQKEYKLGVEYLQKKCETKKDNEN